LFCEVHPTWLASLCFLCLNIKTEVGIPVLRALKWAFQYCVRMLVHLAAAVFLAQFDDKLEHTTQAV
jgi:hypothetical protein